MEEVLVDNDGEDDGEPGVVACAEDVRRGTRPARSPINRTRALPPTMAAILRFGWGRLEVLDGIHGQKLSAGSRRLRRVLTRSQRVPDAVSTRLLRCRR